METAALKHGLDAKRTKIRDTHEKGASGLDVCAALSAVVDEAIIQLFEQEKGKFSGALVALGGYGRGLLNPCSDVDLLFLLGESSGGGASLPTGMLAKLWDLGLKVGHSARTIEDTIAIGLSDLTAKTAMMESRYLAGSKELYAEFWKKYTRRVIRHKPNLFIESKLGEIRKRRMAHGGVVHLTEPNIKESPGGLRDLHSALWLVRSKLDVKNLDDFASYGIISRGEVREIEKAHSTILRIRNSLHWRVEKLSDRLIQSLQPDIARAEGYKGSDNVVAAELMRNYYNSAETIYRFSQEAIAFASGYRRKRVWRIINIDNDGLFTDGAMLHARSFPPNRLERRPALLFRVARRIAEENLTPAPNLWRGLRKLAEDAPEEWFRREQAGRLLLTILKLRNSARAVSVFRETGLLTRFIPEFADITRLSQFDMFHRYSADEHTINTLRKLEGIPEEPNVCWRLRELFRTQPDIEIVKLALLLHDLGKRAEDRHVVEGDAHSSDALERLGLDELKKPIGFLVKNHILMSRTAQHRDFSIPTTLRHFCNEVGSRDNLRRLYLLTYSDIAAVGPDIWNDWKDNLLLDLYERADKYLIEGEALFSSPDEQMDSLLRQIVKSSHHQVSEEEARDFLQRAPDQYIRNADLDTVVEDIKLVDDLKRRALALSFRPNPGDETGRITLAAAESLGFFSIIAGALAAKNVSIVEAQIHTFEGRVALDTVTISGNLSLFLDPVSLDNFTRELKDLLDKKKDLKDMVARRARYIRVEQPPEAPVLEPRVVILNHLSKKSTVVEVWAPDRVGLLYDITRTLAREGFDINSAKIGTEGRMAINVFYLTTEDGGKLKDGGALEKELSEALLSAIRSPMGVD